jgi:HEAT repeat protein
LKDPEAKVRQEAAESLGAFDGQAALEPLMEHLSDDSVEVRRAAILSVGKLGKAKPKVEEALQRFASDPDSLSKLNALIGLAGLRPPDESSIPTLLDAINRKEEATAKAAGRVLSQYAVEKPDNVLPGLIDLLEKKEQPGFLNALRVLIRMKDHASPAMPKIVALYDQVQPEDRIEIVMAVKAIDATGDFAIPVILKALKEPDPLDRKDALTALLSYRPRVDLFLDALIGALNDSDPENRHLAINIIKGLGMQSEKAIPALVTLSEDPDVRVRMAAIGAVSSYRNLPAQAVDALEKSLKDPDFRVRLTAATALGRLSNVDREKALSALQSAMEKETNDGVKRAIISTLDVMRQHPQKALH